MEVDSNLVSDISLKFPTFQSSIGLANQTKSKRGLCSTKTDSFVEQKSSKLGLVSKPECCSREGGNRSGAGRREQERGG